MHEIGRHSLRSPITDRLFTEPLMQVVESDGESPAPGASPLLLRWSFFEQRSLLSKAGEVGQRDRHHAKTDTPA
jgi:hypothetical protein